MRISVAVILGMVILGVGLFGMSQQAQDHEPDMATANESVTNTWNATHGVFEGTSEAGTLLVTYGGALAFVGGAIGIAWMASGGR